MVMAAVPTGAIAMWGSLLFFWGAARLINHKYLHWFPSWRYFDVTPAEAVWLLWSELLPMGALLGTLGTLLLAFAFRRFWYREPTPNVESSGDAAADNPHAAPKL
jgi:hypothetical protein